MAVVVDDRKIADEAVIEIAGDVVLEQEVLVDERHIGSNFGASKWWMTKATRYAEAQMAKRMA